MSPVALVIIEKYKSKLCGEERVCVCVLFSFFLFLFFYKEIQMPVHYGENDVITRVFWKALLEISQYEGLKKLVWVLNEYTFGLKMLYAFRTSPSPI